MKKLNYMLLAIFILTGSACSTERTLPGVYHKEVHIGNFVTRPVYRLLWGSTFAYGVKIQLKKDNTFYHWSSTTCLPSSYWGNWQMKGDTLLLTGYDSTFNADMQEQYLIQGRKLKPITNDRLTLTLRKITNEP